MASASASASTVENVTTVNETKQIMVQNNEKTTTANSEDGNVFVFGGGKGEGKGALYDLFSLTEKLRNFLFV